MKKFAKTHEWINTENGEVGITENAIEQLGDIVFLELIPNCNDNGCFIRTSNTPKYGQYYAFMC